MRTIPSISGRNTRVYVSGYHPDTPGMGALIPFILPIAYPALSDYFFINGSSHTRLSSMNSTTFRKSLQRFNNSPARGAQKSTCDICRCFFAF